MRILIALGLLGLAGWTLKGWNDRRLAVEESTRSTAPSPTSVSEPIRDTRWLQDALGEPTHPPAAYVLQQGLGDWGRFELLGSEFLDASLAGMAARQELARWLERPPGANSSARSLEIRATDEGQAREILLKVQGEARELMAWFGHLLSWPRGQGYLSTPLRVRLFPDSQVGVMGELLIRVHPASAFTRPAVLEPQGS